MIPSQILNYQIIRQLGEGGMGQVFLAQNKSIGQYVAIKVLHPRLANNPVLRQRFKQEAVLLSSLNHPNIVRFLNYVENEHGVFLIMEYVDGMTLQDFIDKKNGLIVEKRAYPLFDEILDAFQYAHSNNIVHLDIKPSNIFLTSDGHIKVMDFGISKIVSEAEKENNQQQMGTPEYMSPEQVLGRSIDRRSDIYSLGVLFHQMLTGRAPYDNTTLSQLEIKQQVINDKLPRMKAYYPYISDGMQKIVDKATQKLPDKRFKDCNDMRKAVTAVLNPPPKSKKIWVVSAVAVLLLGVGVFFVWDYFRTKVVYYGDYVEVFGVPHGIDELSSEQVKHRQYSYRMEMSRRKPRRLTLVNSAGTPVRHGDSESASMRNTDVEYFYTDGGQIDYKKVYDEYGRLLYKLDYDENLKTASFKYDDEYGTPMRLRANTTDTYNTHSGIFERSNISRMLLTFDQGSGRLEQIRYAGLNNEPVGDADNIYGMNYEYDDNGRVSRVTFLDANGKPANNHKGLGYKTYKYDEQGNCNEMKFYSTDGKPSHDGNNCAVVAVEFDDWGNRSAEYYYDADGNPAMRTDIGAFGFAYEIDDNGFLTKHTTLGPDNKPVANKFGFATFVASNDDKGRPTRIDYKDADGKPTNFNDNGILYSAETFEYNDRGLITELSFLDINGKKIDSSESYATATREYDDDGYVVKESFFDHSGRPYAREGYYCGTSVEYDDMHREVKRTFTGKNGEPAMDTDKTYGYTIKYDVKGNPVELTSLGIDHKPAPAPSGIVSIKYGYDDRGNNISREFTGTDGSPIKTPGYFSRIEYSFDPETNQQTEIRFYDSSGLEKTEHKSYDNAGNIIKSYDTDGKSKLIGQVCNNEYDTQNRLVREWYSDINGKPQNVTGLKIGERRIKYDQRNNEVENTYYDCNGKPGLNNLGVHRSVKDYDQYNRVTIEKSYGVDGKPTSPANAVPETHYKYDERGNIIEFSSYNGYGKPVNAPIGAQKMTQKFDNHNRVIETAFFDVNGKPVEVGGSARNEREYDNHGNITTVRSYDKNGKMLRNEKNIYNERDQLIEMRNLDANGNLKNCDYGFCRVTIEFADDNITPEKRYFYNTAGQKINTHTYHPDSDEWY